MILDEKAIINNLFSLTDDRKFCLAYSGGIDSCVLLHLLVTNGVSTRAIHINHGINRKANKWEIFCKKTCDELKVSLLSSKLSLLSSHNKKCSEESMRVERYNAIFKFLQKDESLITAHTLDDNIETVFFRLIRGSGAFGLSGILPTLHHATGAKIIRPLLQITKLQIYEYAREKRIKYINDKSNKDEKFSRNYIRNSIIPVVKKKWPHYTASIANTMYSCKQDYELSREIAFQDLTDVESSGTLCILKLKKLSSLRVFNLLRFWIKSNIHIMPSTKQVQEVIKSVINSKHQSSSFVKINEMSVTKFDGKLHIISTNLAINHIFG